MIDLQTMIDYLKNTLTAKRYAHSENTARTAEKLARIYKQDCEKAFIAGLVHDCTREIKLETQHRMLAGMAIVADDLTLNNKELLHAYTAEYLMRNEFKIIDEEIISAVRFHTTGKENMSMLEKIVFLADVIEPSRSFPGVEYMRRLSEENLDAALLEAYDSSIRYLVGKRALIHPNTFFARNYVLKYFKE